MNILKKLSDIANKLDAQGFYAEADVIDSLIKEAVGQSVHNFPDDVINVPYQKHNFEQGTTIRPRSRKYLNTLNELRKELGLGPGMFDRAVAQRLSKYYPGVWQPGAKQKASDLLAAVRQKKQQPGVPDTGVAVERQPHFQQPQAPQVPMTRGPGPRNHEIPKTISPPVEELIPTRMPPKDISLGPKKEYPVEIPGQAGPSNQEINEQLEQKPKSLYQLQHERRMQQGR